MAVFVVTALDAPDAVAARIAQVFPGKFYRVSNDCYLVATEGTSRTMSDQLGVPLAGQDPHGLGRMLVTSISGYWGFGQNDMWEWINQHFGAATP